jgi:uncharacterized repeat protein (TIGR01451 family)
MLTVKNLKAALLLMTALTLYLPLQAEVKVLLTASTITKVDGTEKKESADKAKPGDVIEYVAEYKNSDKKPVHDVFATLPVPAGMEYVPSTAEPSQVMASTSDGKYAPAPLKRAVHGADGKVTQELVPYSEYRSLRWNLGVMAGGTSKTVRARMKVKAQQ